MYPPEGKNQIMYSFCYLIYFEHHLFLVKTKKFYRQGFCKRKTALVFCCLGHGHINHGQHSKNIGLNKANKNAQQIKRNGQNKRHKV